MPTVTKSKDTNRIGAIIIEHPCKYFDKILQVYASPSISLRELLNLDHLTVMRDEYAKFRATVKRHEWSDKNLADEEALARELASYEAYQILQPQEFKIFKQELKFFGVYQLFDSKLKKELAGGTSTIDPAAIMERIHDDIDYMFCQAAEDESYKMSNFIDRMIAIGGYMSGSLVLKHILNETWPTTDIDIYVNESMLKGMFMINHKCDVYPDNHSILKKFATVADAQGVANTAQEAEYAISLGLMLAKYFGAKLEKVHTRTGTHLDKTKTVNQIATTDDILGENPVDDSVYCCRRNAIAEGISAVIKLELHGVKVDIVIVNTTVPFFIKTYFDFDFNQVFYDGYNITVLDWKAVLNKRCQNTLQKGLGTRHIEYLVNIERILEYTQRGFIIQPRN